MAGSGSSTPALIDGKFEVVAYGLRRATGLPAKVDDELIQAITAGIANLEP